MTSHTPEPQVPLASALPTAAQRLPWLERMSSYRQPIGLAGQDAAPLGDGGGKFGLWHRASAIMGQFGLAQDLRQREILAERPSGQPQQQGGGGKQPTPQQPVVPLTPSQAKLWPIDAGAKAVQSIVEMPTGESSGPTAPLGSGSTPILGEDGQPAKKKRRRRRKKPTGTDQPPTPSQV